MLGQVTLGQVPAGNAAAEAIIFLSYALICTALFKRRFSQSATVFALAAAGVVIFTVNAALMLLGEATLMLTLLPLTAYLPFSLFLYFLSEGGVLDTASVCSVGTLGVLILRSLLKVLIGFANLQTEASMLALLVITNAVIALAAAGLVFAAFRFIGGAFRQCTSENRLRRFSVPVTCGFCLSVILAFLMMFYYLESTTDEVMLFFTMMISVLIFFISASLVKQAAELARSRRTEKELSEYIDIQRRGYDRVVQKMESIREYRHDMRHHLTVIEGLAKQGDCGKIVEYTGKLNGSFGKSAGFEYCKNPELNAVLSEYIGRAESKGVRVNQSFILPELLPFEENDVCLVLANAVENAINACVKLPAEKRYINVSAEYRDGRLLISIENPCSEEIRFDENGLPVTEGSAASSKDPELSHRSSDEHGIGLRSVKRIAEKYNGFLRCMLENGEFVFQTALSYDNGGSSDKKKDAKPASVPKRALSSLLGLCLGTVVMLNLLPSAAEAASELLSVNIRTVRSLDLKWGSNSVNEEIPEFDGDGSEELNTAVKSYTDEAREKFMWYFNRRYTGYVAEDMRYTVIRDDESCFIAQFNVTINAGGSMDYSRWITFDKTEGRVLELSDLFKEGSDYIGVISAEILEQMLYKNEHEGGGFFVEGDDAFTRIDGDANFYIDSFDRLVIVFDEYEVAPGFMGSPEFFIPKKVLKEIAR
ncbi:MAG: GHKL domain-containing protein [Firmicutes bacterium]|nr:GHKL domain-containing protein [[Eubacterium] siraeum]MCM1487072.1 GHKL domain-containing protein [Bacillota bacterium]